MKLHFEENPLGFGLVSDYERKKSLLGYHSYTPFSTQADTHPETKEIVCFSLVFNYPDIEPVKQLGVEVSYANKIPGRCTVPELGLKYVSFKEVLEAVKRYYEAKLSQRQPTKTTV